MKKITILVAVEIIILIILLVIFTSLLQGSPKELVPEWKRTLYDDNSGWSISFIECQGDIYVIGHTSSFGRDQDIIISRYNTEGELVWEETWGTSEFDRAYRAYSFNGSIYIAGITGDYNKDSLLLKCNSNGQIEWERTWDGDNDEWGHGITIYQNFIYIIGNTNIRGWHSEIFLLKYDLEGNLIWDKSWQSQNMKFGHKMIVHDGYLYALGKFSQYSASNRSEYLLKYDLDGNPIWNQSWGVGDYGVEEFRGLVGYKGGIYVVGSKSIDDNRLLYIKKFNPQGNILWEKTWVRVHNSRNYGMGVCEWDGYLYVVGKTTMDNIEDTNVVLLKYDTKGNLIWSKLWGEKGIDRVIDIICIDGFIYLLGSSETSDPPSFNVFIMKVDTNDIPIYWGAVIIIFGIILVIIVDAILIHRTNKTKTDEIQLDTEVQGQQIFLKVDEIEIKDDIEDDK